MVAAEMDTSVAALAVDTSVAPDILAEVAVATVVARVVATYPLVVAGAGTPANTVDLAQIDLADQAGVDWIA